MVGCFKRREIENLYGYKLSPFWIWFALAVW